MPQNKCELIGKVVGPIDTFMHWHIKLPVYVTNDMHFMMKFFTPHVHQILEQLGFSREQMKRKPLWQFFNGAKVKVVIEFIQ